MSRKAIDWTAIKTAYITGDESQRQLAVRFGVSSSALADKCRSEDWVAQRKKFRSDTVAKAAQKASRTRAHALAKVIEASDRLDDVLTDLLQKLATEGIGLLVLNGNPGRELESLSKAVLNSDELKRRLNGLLMPRDEARMRIDREKLELEKEKLAKEESKDAKDIEFRLAPELEELAK